jgi:hypothetical protein
LQNSRNGFGVSSKQFQNIALTGQGGVEGTSGS